MGNLALAQLPDWPAAMPRDLALAYTNVSATQLDEWVRCGLVRFSPRGPRGMLIAPRGDLDVALKSLFDTDMTEGPIEF